MLAENPTMVIHYPEIGHLPCRMSISSNLILLANWSGLNIARLDPHRLVITHKIDVSSPKRGSRYYRRPASHRSLVKWSYQRNNPTFAYCNANGISLYMCNNTDAVCSEIPYASNTPYCVNKVVRALDWSSISENLFACGFSDSLVNIYDYRDCREPVLCLNVDLSICQVHWSSFNGNMIAVSTRPGCVLVYDIRKCSNTQFKIHEIDQDKLNKGCLACISSGHEELLDSDWNQFNQHRLVTLGSNGLLKLWDLTSSKSCRHELQIKMSPNPRGRVSFVPHSNQIIACTTDECLLVADNVATTSTHSPNFDGKTSGIKRKSFLMKPPVSEFDFMNLLSVNFLVGWSQKASSLMIWTCPTRGTDLSDNRERRWDQDVLDTPSDKPITPFISNSWKGTFSMEKNNSVNSLQIENEFAIIRQSSYKHLHLKYADSKSGHCQLVGKWRNRRFLLKINCPTQISIDCLPSFTFGPTTVMPFLPPALSNIVRHTCIRQVHKQRLCLDACLRQISGFISEQNSQWSMINDLPKIMDFDTKSTSHMGNVVRSCLARFHHSGILICVMSGIPYKKTIQTNSLRSIQHFDATSKFFRSRSLTTSKGKRFLQLQQCTRNHSPPSNSRNFEKQTTWIHMFIIGCHLRPRRLSANLSINHERIMSSFLTNSDLLNSFSEGGRQWNVFAELWKSKSFDSAPEFKMIMSIIQNYSLLGDFYMFYLLSGAFTFMQQKSNICNETYQLMMFSDMLLFSNMGARHIQAIELLNCLSTQSSWQQMFNVTVGGYVSSKHLKNQERNCVIRNVINCCYCRIPVKGLYICCKKCGHGGHVHHIIRWFETHTACICTCVCRF